MKKTFSGRAYFLVSTLLLLVALATILAVVQFTSTDSMLRLALLSLYIIPIIAAFFFYRKILEKEKAFDETYEKLSAIFEFTPVGIYIAELTSGIILDVNQGYLDMFGYEKSELIGNSSVALGIMDIKEREQLVAEVHQCGFVRNKVMRFKPKSGVPFTCVLSYKLVKIKGKECGIVLLNSASTHKDLDTALLENMRKFQTIFDSSPTGISIVELESGIIFDSNESFLQTYGYTKEEVIGHSTIELGIIRPDDRKKYITELKSEGSLRNREEITFSKSGKKITALLSDIIIDLNGNKYSLTLLNDISNRKELEDQLAVATEKNQVALKAKERFLTNVSHELRTPMNGIIGMVNLLAQTQLNAEQKEYATGITDASNILLAIINDILDISKINAEKMVFEVIPFNVYDTLNNLRLLMEPQIAGKDISVFTHMGAGIPQKIMGDPMRLFQIFLNIVGNAIKFTQQGEINIFINVKKEDLKNIWLEFIIKDTGIGIDPESIPLLFEPFMQASLDTTRKYGGTGLGLSISKRLVEMQGGTIYAESKVGKGSVFSFQIEYEKYIEAEKQPTILLKKDTINEESLSGVRVLLVEDNKISQKVGLRTLSNWGIIAELAENGRLAVEMVAANYYDAVLMDIQMPEMDGIEATTKIRSLASSSSKVPIIAMTASTTLLNKEKCVSLGMDDYISKPFNPEALHDVILKWVNTTKGK